MLDKWFPLKTGEGGERQKERSTAHLGEPVCQTKNIPQRFHRVASRFSPAEICISGERVELDLRGAVGNSPRSVRRGSRSRTLTADLPATRLASCPVAPVGSRGRGEIRLHIARDPHLRLVRKVRIWKIVGSTRADSRLSGLNFPWTKREAPRTAWPGTLSRVDGCSVEWMDAQPSGWMLSRVDAYCVDSPDACRELRLGRLEALDDCVELLPGGTAVFLCLFVISYYVALLMLFMCICICCLVMFVCSSWQRRRDSLAGV